MFNVSAPILACGSFTKHNKIANAVPRVEHEINRILGEFDPHEDRQLPEHFLCTICLEEHAYICTIGCGHLASCKECFKRLRLHSVNNHLPLKCPVCRAAVLNTASLNRPYNFANYPCQKPNCPNRAIVFHDTCMRLVICQSCAVQEGEERVEACLSCLKREGTLKRLYFPEIETSDDRPPDFEEDFGFDSIDLD